MRALDSRENALDDFILAPNKIEDEVIEEISYDAMPTTNAGECQMTIEEETPKGMRVSRHAMLNQCGSLLARSNNVINSHKSKKHFLQRIAVINVGDSMPLLHPEAMMFPSMFWKSSPNNGSFIGAIPSCLLSASQSIHGFASIKQHAENRLTFPFSLTSTN